MGRLDCHVPLAPTFMEVPIYLLHTQALTVPQKFEGVKWIESVNCKDADTHASQAPQAGLHLTYHSTIESSIVKAA